MIPGKLETYARTSFVTGRFGGGNEFGGGVNWYPRALATGGSPSRYSRSTAHRHRTS